MAPVYKAPPKIAPVIERANSGSMNKNEKSGTEANSNRLHFAETNDTDNQAWGWNANDDDLEIK